MTRRTVLVVVDNNVRPGQTVPAPSCATCRWAEASRAWLDDPSWLECRRHGYDAPWRTDAKPRVDGSLLEGEENDTGDSRVHVAPDFGCVQWEAK